MADYGRDWNSDACRPALHVTFWKGRVEVLCQGSTGGVTLVFQ